MMGGKEWVGNTLVNNTGVGMSQVKQSGRQHHSFWYGIM